MAEWVDGVGEVRGVDDDLDVGSRFRSDYAYRGETFEVTCEVTAYEPPHRLDLRSTDGPFPFTGCLRLVEVDGGTEISNTIDAGSDGLATTVVFAAFGPVVRPLMRRQLASELDSLETALAGGAR